MEDIEKIEKIYRENEACICVKSIVATLYMYMHAVGSMIGPHVALCWVNKWATCSFLSFLCFINILLSAGRMRFLKQNNASKNIIETTVLGQ